MVGSSLVLILKEEDCDMFVEKLSRRVMAIWMSYTVLWLVFQVLKMIFTKVSFFLVVEILAGLFLFFVGLIAVGLLVVFFVGDTVEYSLSAVIEDIISVVKGAVVLVMTLCVLPIVVASFAIVVLFPFS
jgi:hypothetical protein